MAKKSDRTTEAGPGKITCAYCHKSISNKDHAVASTGEAVHDPCKLVYERYLTQLNDDSLLNDPGF